MLLNKIKTAFRKIGGFFVSFFLGAISSYPLYLLQSFQPSKGWKLCKRMPLLSGLGGFAYKRDFY
jgi:hypothetical protein